jgi:hypothetical protein
MYLSSKSIYDFRLMTLVIEALSLMYKKNVYIINYIYLVGIQCLVF